MIDQVSLNDALTSSPDLDHDQRRPGLRSDERVAMLHAARASVLRRQHLAAGLHARGKLAPRRDSDLGSALRHLERIADRITRTVVIPNSGSTRIVSQ